MARPGFVGARITKNNIGGAFGVIRQAVSDEMEKGAQRVLATGNELVPRRSEALADSGKVVQLGPMTFVVSWGEGLPDARAVYQEYGTAHHPAQPYATPALDQETPGICEGIAARTHGRVKHTNVRVARIDKVAKQ
jgi:hypothetical protein